MQSRLDFPGAARSIGALHAFVHSCGLEHGLLELVKLRASQIKGCAHCIDMHLQGASRGRRDRATPIYSARERAALAWTEAVTDIAGDVVYKQAASHFNPEELVNLSMAIVAINAANRLNIAFRTGPGSYMPRKR